MPNNYRKHQRETLASLVHASRMLVMFEEEQFGFLQHYYTLYIVVLRSHWNDVRARVQSHHYYYHTW